MKKNIVTEIDTNAFTLFAKKKKEKKCQVFYVYV